MEVRILKQEIIGPAQVRDVLEKQEKELKKATKGKEEKSLVSAQQKTKDNIVRFNKLNKADEAKLIKELEALKIARMSEKHISQIINVMPRDLNELKIIFAGSKTTLTQEDLEKIQGTIKQYDK